MDEIRKCILSGFWTAIYTMRKLHRFKIWQVWETLTWSVKNPELGWSGVLWEIMCRKWQSGPERKGDTVCEWEEGWGEVGVVSKVEKRRLDYGSLNTRFG